MVSITGGFTRGLAHGTIPFGVRNGFMNLSPLGGSVLVVLPALPGWLLIQKQEACHT